MRIETARIAGQFASWRRSVLCLAGILAATHCSFAEEAAKYWVTAITGEATEGAFSVQETLDGGAVVAGFHRGPDDWEDDDQALLVRLTAGGKVKWQETLVAPSYIGDEYLYSVRQAADGGFIAVGRAAAPDWYAAAVLKLDRAGKTIWKKYLTGGAAAAHDVLATSDGGCVVLADIEAFDREPPDLYLIKFDRRGVLEWQTRYGRRPDWEWAKTITQTSDGGYFITACGYSRYPLLVRLDSTGAITWSKYVPLQVGFDDVVSACETADGGYLVSFSDPQYGKDNTDIHIMRLDASGKAVWQSKLDSGYPDRARQVIRTRDGNFVVVGTTKQKASYSDALLMKIDPSGKTIWQRTYGSPLGPESGNGVCETKDGGLLMAGNSHSFGNGDSDIWVLRLDKDGLLGDSSCDIIGTPALQSSATKLKMKSYKASVFGMNLAPGTLEWSPVTSHLSPKRICASVGSSTAAE